MHQMRKVQEGEDVINENEITVIFSEDPGEILPKTPEQLKRENDLSQLQRDMVNEHRILERANNIFFGIIVVIAISCGLLVAIFHGHIL
jgi:hypothetical protein